MRPEDYESLARVMSRKIKEIVTREIQTNATRLDTLEATIEDQRKTIEDQVQFITELTKTIEDQTKIVTDLTDQLKQAITHAESLEPAKGEKGDVGEVDYKVLIDDCREFLRKYVVEHIKDFRGPAGKDAEEVSYDTLADTISKSPFLLNTIKELIPDPIPGEKGERGSDASVEECTKTVLDYVKEHQESFKGPQGEQGIPGAKGEQGDQGPVGPKGDPGEKGADGAKGDPGEKGSDGAKGEPGRNGDSVMVEDVLEAIEDSGVVNKLVKALVEKQLPDMIPKPLAPNDLQVVEAVKHLWPSIRLEVIKSLPQIEHKGVWEPGEYAPGDEVIRNDSSYRAKCVTREAPPHEDWQCIAKSKVGRKGPQGEQGVPGEPGQPGVGVQDVLVEDTMFVMTLSNEEAYTIDFSELISKGIQNFMRKGDHDDA